MNTHSLECTFDEDFYRSFDVAYSVMQEELEWMRLGWHIPRKINAPKKYGSNRIRMQTRNQLPRKVRAVDYS